MGMGTGRSKSRADDVAICVNAESQGSIRETRPEKRVQVYHAGRAARPHQGVKDDTAVDAQAHLLTARNAKGCRINKPAGVEVYGAGGAACPQQGVLGAAAIETETDAHLLTARNALGYR